MFQLRDKRLQTVPPHVLSWLVSAVLGLNAQMGNGPITLAEALKESSKINDNFE